MAGRSARDSRSSRKGRTGPSPMRDGRPHACSSPGSRRDTHRRKSAEPAPARGRSRRSVRRRCRGARCGIAGCRAPTPGAGQSRRALRSRGRIIRLWSAPPAASPPPPDERGGVPSEENEAAPAADTASTGGHRVTRVWFFCAALRPLPTFGGQPLRELSTVPDGERIASTLRRTDDNVKGVLRMNVPSYVHGANDRPLLGEPIFQHLRPTAARFGDREALVVAHQTYRATYGELVAQCEEVACGLIARGVKKGDRVGIWSPNRYEWVIVQYATSAMGAILVNINPAYRTSELEYALNQSGISFLILAARFRQADYVAMLGEVKGRCPGLREALVLEDGWDALKRDGTKVEPGELHELEATLQFDDPINIQYTSGTTGFPKGATLTHHNILNNGYFIGETLRYTEQDRVCIPVPFYHCFGMVLGNLACTTHGSTMVIPAEAYDPVLTMETVQQERCTSLYGVPTMFIGELEHARFKDFDFSSLRTGIMAGSPCPVEVMKKVQTVRSEERRVGKEWR